MNELKVKSTGELISFYDASLSTGIDNWLWTFSASVANLVALNKFKPIGNLGADYVEVSFKLGLESFALIIEKPDSNDTAHTFPITGRSRSVLLAAPYSLAITKTWADTTAWSIVQELCDNANVILNWAVIDWDIKSYVVDKRYPIDIITDLVGDMDLGAIVQSLPDGSLTVIYYPSCSPAKLAQQTPAFTISTSKNLFTRAQQFVNNSNYNSVLVTSENSGNSAIAPSVSIESVVDGVDRLLRVSVSPLVPASEINLHHTSGDNVAIWYEGVFSNIVTDQLIVQDGKAQLSKPFDSLVDVQWHQNVVGTLSIDRRGAITTDQGFGLTTVVYNSKYHQYRVSNLTGVGLTAIAVDDIDTPVDVSALSILYVQGAGDRSAPPVVVKTLSSLAALLKRGEAELWKQLYDADDYAIGCVYENTPLLAGKIAEVFIRDEGLKFNGLIKSVSITIGKVISQAVVIERPLL